MEWISVKDRMPELLTDVLVLTIEPRDYTILKYNSHMQVAFLFERLVSEFESEESKKDILRWSIFGDITHWMPLPEYPKEELCAEKK